MISPILHIEVCRRFMRCPAQTYRFDDLKSEVFAPFFGWDSKLEVSKEADDVLQDEVVVYPSTQVHAEPEKWQVLSQGSYCQINTLI